MRMSLPSFQLALRLCPRTLKRVMPAASSKTMRRSSGLWTELINLACSMMEYADLPMPVSKKSSRMSRS